ncbi:hypothetical protein N9K06_00370 [Omnitrophica bacterium]|nr:hypothetical protein [Candidatus Omnitrophota bacterium]
MKKVGIMLLSLLFFASVCPVYAASPWTENDSYLAKTLGKLEFGITNILGGWTELFNAPERHYDQGGNPFGAIGIGFYNAVVYTAGGIIHAGTFFVPVDVPIPNNGVDIEDVSPA